MADTDDRAVDLGYIAVEAGWIVREVGRQPWLVHGVLRTSDGVSVLPASAVTTSLAALTMV